MNQLQNERAVAPRPGRLAPTAEDLAVMDDLQTRYLSPIRDWDGVYLLYQMTP